MLRMFFCILLYILQPFFSDALTFFEMGHEPYGYIPSDVWYGQISNLNDGYGPRYATEWDNARTAAIEMRLRTPFLFTFEYGASILTWRSSKKEPKKTSRVDEMHFALGLQFQRSILGGRGWTNIGVGGLFFGNLGGYATQQGIHRFFKVNRGAVPLDKYDNFASAVLATGEMGMASPWNWPLQTSISAAVTSLGYWEIEPELSFNLESPFGHARAGVSYRIINTGNAPTTATRVIKQNAGLLINLDFALSIFRSSYWISPVTGVSMGSYSFMFSSKPNLNYYAHWQGDYRVELAFNFKSLGYVNRISWTPYDWNFDVFRTAVVFAGNSALIPSRTEQAEGGEQSVYVGAELYADFGETVFFEPFFGILTGFLSRKRTYLESFYQANYLGAAGIVVSRVELGFRFYPFKTKISNRVLRYGLVAGLALDAKFERPITADFHYYLGISFGDEVARQGLNF